MQSHEILQVFSNKLTELIGVKVTLKTCIQKLLGSILVGHWLS
jgi:hypothetical protein